MTIMSKTKVLILYGSETGQSESISEILEERVAEAGICVQRFELNCIDTDYSIQEENVSVIVCSSTGDGDPPENAAKFFRRIRQKSHPRDLLSRMRFALLGLGDSNYTSFLNCPKTIEKRLMELGAKQFYASGFCDDQVGTDLVAEPWMDGLLPALRLALADPGYIIRPVGGSIIEAKREPSPDIVRRADTPPTEHDINDALVTIKSDVIVENYVAGLDLASPESLELCSQTEVSPELTEVFPEQSFDGEITQSPSDLNGNDVELSLNDTAKIEDQFCSLSITGDLSSRQCHCSSFISEDSLLRFSAPNEILSVPKPSAEFLNVRFNENDAIPPVPPSDIKLGAASFPSSASEIVSARLTNRSLLTKPDASKRKYEIWIELPEDCDILYEPGDAFYFICPNAKVEVDFLLHRLSLSSVCDEQCTISVMENTNKKNAKIPVHLPENGTTIRDLFRRCIDIRKPVSKTLLRILAEYCMNDDERKKLLYLCSLSGTNDYIRFVIKQKLNLLDLLHSIPSCQPPMHRLLEHLPRLQPRPYSVASYRTERFNSIRFVYTLVQLKAEGDRFYYREGLCTGWLTSIPIGTEIPVFLKKPTSFRLSPHPQIAPMIMVGPGAGIAPFLGFMEKLRSYPDLDTTDCQRWLFFGCRSEADYIFKSEQDAYNSDGLVSHFHVCFSRANSEDMSDGREKKNSAKNGRHTGYVQDAMRLYGDEICKLMLEESLSAEQKCRIYICGDATGMAKDVLAALTDMLQMHAGMSYEEAIAYMKRMQAEGRYLQDIW